MTIEQKIQAAMSQIQPLLDTHRAISFGFQVTPLATGAVEVNCGHYGSATLASPEHAHAYLLGLLMGLNINQG